MNPRAALIGTLVAALTVSTQTLAAGPYATIQDDGSIAKELKAQGDPITPLLKLYATTGFPVPQILSVWTTFPQDGEVEATFFLPQQNDVGGVGLESWGIPAKSSHPPLEDVLFHNDVLQIAKRASKAGAPADGYAAYLFLLEISHKWCSNALVPALDGGASDDLIGFPSHWSFWMDAGGSPAGGNRWHDNGDGTFTVEASSPSTVAFSLLDLYLMGLADASEVQPFGVLEGPVPPPGVKDGIWGGAYSAKSFPWFSSTPFTVQANGRRVLTIDDIVAANGKRSPAFGQAPTHFSLGIVLLASVSDTPTSIASAQAVFDPIASSLAPRFQAATQNRGTLDVVTIDPSEADAGAHEDSGPAESADGGTNDAPGSSSSGCTIGWAATPPGSMLSLVGLTTLGLATHRRRRRRATRVTPRIRPRAEMLAEARITPS
jgi:hypothetical protein